MMFPAFMMAFALFLLSGDPAAAQTLRQQQQREAYEKQIDMRLQEVNQKLSTLRISNSALTEDTKRELGRLDEELKSAQEMANRKVSAMKSAGGQDWERLKSEAYAAIETLNRIHGRMQSLKK